MRFRCVDLGTCVLQSSGLPRVVVDLAFFLSQPFGDALDPHLSLMLDEPKSKCSLWVAFNVLRFVGRGPVRVDNETTMIKFLQVDNTGRDPPGGKMCSRERRGRGLRNVGCLCLIEPAMELKEGIFIASLVRERIDRGLG